jgi:hypothetical protein
MCDVGRAVEADLMAVMPDGKLGGELEEVEDFHPRQPTPARVIFQDRLVEWADGLKEGGEPITAQSSLLIGLAMDGNHGERLRIRGEMVPITRSVDIAPELLGAGESYRISSQGVRVED